MHRVLEHIDRHLDETLELETLAAVANFSPFHFHRLFAAWMGETLGEYLRRRRLEMAALRLITQPDTPVLHVALSVGFASAEAFARLNITVDAVVASPLVRAHQTAMEFVSVLAPALRVVTCDELAFDKLKPGKLSDFLANLPSAGDRLPTREEKAVVAVGHMPDLAEYCEWLMGAEPGTIRFAKAAVACLHFEGDPERASGALEWLVTPEWI
jgi:AraC-like DNA-binding protein